MRNSYRSHTEDEVVTRDSAEPHGAYASTDEVQVVDDGRAWYDFDVVGRVNSVLFTVLFVIEALLALRFAFAAFGANPNSGFVDFIYDVSWPLVRPFDGAFGDRTWDEGVVEVSTLLAMGVWALIFVIIAMLVAAIIPRFGRDYDASGPTSVHRRRVTHTGSH
jgi:hypothetical protein